MNKKIDARTGEHEKKTSAGFGCSFGVMGWICNLMLYVRYVLTAHPFIITYVALAFQKIIFLWMAWMGAM